MEWTTGSPVNEGKIVSPYLQSFTTDDEEVNRLVEELEEETMALDVILSHNLDMGNQYIKVADIELFYENRNAYIRWEGGTITTNDFLTLGAWKIVHALLTRVLDLYKIERG